MDGFKKLKEYKFNKIQIIVEPGQKGAPEQIVGIVKRSRLTDLLKTFKNKSNAVKKLVKTALKDQDVLNEYTRIKKRLQEGINPVDIGKKSTLVSSNKVLIKRDEGRYLVEVSENQVNVLGICARGNKKNVKSFENLMNGMYGVNLQY